MIVLFLSLIAFAEELQLPSVYCEDPFAIAQRTGKCNNNGNFLTASIACFSKLEALEKKLGVGINETAAAGKLSQAGRNQAGESSFAESVKAFQHLEQVAQLARNELLTYPDHIVDTEFLADPEADPFERADKRECFGGVDRGLKLVIHRLDQKIQIYRARGAEAAKHAAALQQSGKSYETKSGPLLEKQTVQDSSAQGKAGNSSSISGTTEPKK